MCFALALWNGRDPFLKERIFGLSGPEGNHGEDTKEYWWYVDATPTSSLLKWRYHYPQAEFPYARLRQENAKRGRKDREFELIDTGIFEGDRYWQITTDYAKATPADICVRIRVRNAGPEAPSCTCCPRCGFATAGPGKPAASVPRCKPVRRKPELQSSLSRNSDLDAGVWLQEQIPTGHAARAAVLRERNQFLSPVRYQGDHAISQRRHQRSRRCRRGHGQSRTARNKDGVLVPFGRSPRRDR